MRPTLLALVPAALLACQQAPPPPTPSRPAAPVTEDDAPRGCLAPVRGDTRTDQSLRAMQEVVRRTPGRARPLLRLSQLFVRKARESADPGWYQQADDAVQRALRIDPGDLAALEVRGLVLLQDHRFGEVKALAERAIARARDHAAFWGLLGDAEMELGRYEAAEAAYQRMLDLRPNLASYSRGAWMRWLLGDAEGALDLARRAVEAGSPRVPEELAWALVAQGQLALATGALDEAEAAFGRALGVFPGYGAALDGRGSVRHRRGDLAGAVTDFTAAVEAATTTEHLVHLADALEAAGHADEARAVFARAERAGRRSDPRALALAYADRDLDNDGAVALARRELAARPDDVYTLDAAAWTLFRAGQLDEAATLSARARRLGTPEARFAWHAGRIALARGQRAEAVALLRDALARNPHLEPRAHDDVRRALDAQRAVASR